MNPRVPCRTTALKAALIPALSTPASPSRSSGVNGRISDAAQDQRDAEEFPLPSNSPDQVNIFNSIDFDPVSS